MKIINIIALYCIILFCFSCQTEKSTNNNKPDSTSALIIGDPMNYGFENKLIFPVGKIQYHNIPEKRVSADTKLSFTVNKLSNFDRYAQQEYINPNTEDFDISNIIFYDLINNEKYTLVEKPIHIISFALHQEFINKLIFYRIVNHDSNKDSAYTTADAVSLYISDLNGKNFIQITADNENFIDYFYYPQQQKIIVKTNIDSNNDLKWNNKDATNFYSIDLNKPNEKSIELFDNNFKANFK